MARSYLATHAKTPLGWSEWFRVTLTRQRISCCDCKLVHDFEFRVVDREGNIVTGFRIDMRARRNGKATGGIRRHFGRLPCR